MILGIGREEYLSAVCMCCMRMDAEEGIYKWLSYTSNTGQWEAAKRHRH